MEIAEFLLARFAEDEAVARGATPGPWFANIAGGDEDDCQVGTAPEIEGRLDRRGEIAPRGYDTPGPAKANADHIARWDPARVLAECAAKRRIVEWCSERNRVWVGRLGDDPTDTANYVPGDYVHQDDAPVLRLLALPYTDHPDYQSEWKP